MFNKLFDKLFDVVTKFLASVGKLACTIESYFTGKKCDHFLPVKPKTRGELFEDMKDDASSAYTGFFTGEVSNPHLPIEILQFYPNEATYTYSIGGSGSSEVPETTISDKEFFDDIAKGQIKPKKKKKTKKKKPLKKKGKRK